MKELFRDFFIPCEKNGFKPRILETQFFFLLLGLLVGLKILTLVSFWGNFGATIFNQVSQDDLYTLINDTRTANGVNKLQVNSKLEAVAQLKLSDMFRNNYFAHTSPSGVDPWDWFDKANYDYQLAGENLAMSFISSDEVLNAWLKSESHRKNLLLNNFKETGIAVGSGIINGQQTVAVVQVFGTPKISVLEVQAKPISKIKSGIIPKPSLTPQINSTPKPQTTIKTDPISLKKIVATIPQVKSAIADKYFWEEYGPYLVNDSLKKIMILFAVMAVLILFLKVFVAFSVQFPKLILRSAILIVISLSLVFIKDENFIQNKIKITEKAEIIISHAK